MRALLVSALLALALSALAPAARAGTYDVWSCQQLPTGRSAPIDGWSVLAGSLPGIANGCASYQGFGAELPSGWIPELAHAGWQFDAPPNVSIAGYELYRRASTARGPDSSERDYLLFHDRARIEPGYLADHCIVVAGCSSIGDLGSANLLDPDNRLAKDGLALSRIMVKLQCRDSMSNDGCDASASTASYLIASARLRLRDATPPALDPPTGSLVADGAMLEGPEGVSVAASDAGAGIRRFRIVVDGQSIAEEPVDPAGTCHEPYIVRVPCPSRATRSIAFDTARISNGPHLIQVVAEDAAGNRTLSAPAHVTVVNGGLPNGIRASRQALLSVGLGRSRGAQDEVPYRARPIVMGRLRNGSGKPIRNATVEVVRFTDRPGAQARTEGSARTNAEGRFRFRARRGPSRRLIVRYRAFSLDPRASAEATVHLRVRAGVRLAVRPRRTTSRGTIVFSGRVLGGPGRGGTQVALYAVGRGAGRRVPVSILAADRAGRFRFKYRFVRTYAPFTYRFVARVEAQAGYPYAAGASRPAVVRIVR